MTSPKDDEAKAGSLAWLGLSIWLAVAQQRYGHLYSIFARS
jgi:hypothetical protein